MKNVDPSTQWQIYDYVVSGMLIRHKTWRAGQGMFNALVLVRPDLAEEIRGGELDPFHNNKKLPAFKEWLRKRIYK